MSDLLTGATGRGILRAISPGTALRDGLERILRGRTGALIVIGYDDVVESICSGGFELDVAFSSTRLRELAKMDGAIVLNSSRIGRYRRRVPATYMSFRFAVAIHTLRSARSTPSVITR